MSIIKCHSRATSIFNTVDYKKLKRKKTGKPCLSGRFFPCEHGEIGVYCNVD